MLWKLALGLAVAVAVAVTWVASREPAAPAPQPSLQPPPPPPTPTTDAAPARLRRMKDREVTPAISAHAKRILREHGADPYGTEIPFEADGKRYVAKLERHYHEPGGAARPWGWHKGVSVFAVVEDAPAPPSRGLVDALTGS